jgi:DNA-binding protein HU-beta
MEHVSAHGDLHHDPYPLNSIFTKEYISMKQMPKEKNMNKATLITSISEISGLSKPDSKKALEATLQSIQQGLKQGQVRLPGFGNFIVTNREAREGHNPRTKEIMKIAASKTPKFRASQMLKEAIA